MLDISTLNEKSHQELKDMAKELRIGDYDKLKKQELVYRILDMQASRPETADILNKQATQKEITIKKEKDKPHTMHDPEKTMRPRRRRISPSKKEDGSEKEILNDASEDNNGSESAVAEPAAENMKLFLHRLLR